MGHLVTISGDRVHKRYEAFDRDEHYRESTGLRLLERYAPGLAPRLIAVALDDRPPHLTMARLPGRPLSVADLAGPAHSAVYLALDRLYSAVPPAVLADLPCSLGAAEVMLPRVRRMCAKRPPHPAVAQWLDALDPAAVATVEPVFGRGDHNLANFLLAGEDVRLVDFEDSGRSDRIMELAQFMEHASAVSLTEADWAPFRRGLDAPQSARLADFRRLMAIFWLQLKAGTPLGAVYEQRALRLIRGRS
ncbi:MAG TPA: hypothetical protein VHC49_20540 [Mycobacteriales bacterium]|nr:hypothetical protein [Mycobacteriales bacterium]